MKEKVTIQFWGVRGSTPRPDKKLLGFGGNTACVSIHYKHHTIICDAGTGIYPLGKKLANSTESIAILWTHLHWDHVIGFPFFAPAREKGRELFLAGPAMGFDNFKEALSGMIRPPFFPLTPEELPAKLQWQTLQEDRFKIGPILVESKKVRHGKMGAYAYSFHFPGGKRLVHVSDGELLATDTDFIHWIHRADILIHDGNYTAAEYRERLGWGHSSYEEVIQAARMAEVKKLILFHHGTDTTDAILQKRARSLPKNCCLAKEGMRVVF